MAFFFELKYVVGTLCFLGMYGIKAEKLTCAKSDECSCKTSTKPQKVMSLWTLPRRNKIQSKSGLLFDVDLCHGFDKNADAKTGGCLNATVCQYSDIHKNRTYEVGKFGNATFGLYDNDKNEITLQYYGAFQEHITRTIIITLKCNESGSNTQAKYSEIQPSLFTLGKFITTITTKAACLHSVLDPMPTSRGKVGENDGGLKNGYIVLIALGATSFLAVLSFVAYKMVMKRKRVLLINEEEETEDYGTMPQADVQNALLTPASGPI